MSTLRTAGTTERLLVGAPTVSRWRWIDLPGYLAAGWSLGYAVVVLWLAVAEPDGLPGWLPGAGRAGAPVLVLIGLLGAAVALVTNRRQGHGIPRLALLAFAWSAAALLLILPDQRAIAWFVVGLLFHSSTLDWPALGDAIGLAGGLSWAVVALGYQSFTGGSAPTDRVGR